MKRIVSFWAVCCTVLLFCACGSDTGGQMADQTDSKPQEQTQAQEKGSRDNTPVIYTPSADGTQVLQCETAVVDVSNASQGYVMLNYSGSGEKVKLQITTPDSITYTYNVTKNGSYEAYPLSGGDGTYEIGVYENVVDDKYAVLLKENLEVTLQDEFGPFLYSNQYVYFQADSKAVSFGQQLAEPANTDFDVVQAVYDYVISHVTYDTQKADTVQNGYLPNVDETLESGTGICLDYAALMAAMLRSQGIPTKLQVGYSGEAYHAWISVYTKEAGWLDAVIQFDGNTWQLLDPTLAANNSEKKVADYIGDGTNYTLKYSY